MTATLNIASFAVASLLGACAHPGEPGSDIATATFGDPSAEGGVAGAVTVTSKGCSPPSDGVYATQFVEQPSGTCGPVTDGYVNGASLSAAPYCPHGKGSMTTATVTVDGGAHACAIVVKLSGCVVSADTVITSASETGTWSAEDSTFTGETAISATTSGGRCASTYDVTFTRQ